MGQTVLGAYRKFPSRADENISRTQKIASQKNCIYFQNLYDLYENSYESKFRPTSARIMELFYLPIRLAIQYLRYTW